MGCQTHKKDHSFQPPVFQDQEIRATRISNLCLLIKLQLLSSSSHCQLSAAFSSLSSHPITNRSKTSTSRQPSTHVASMEGMVSEAFLERERSGSHPNCHCPPASCESSPTFRRQQKSFYSCEAQHLGFRLLLPVNDRRHPILDKVV